jgi:hypothetical protein
MNKEKGFVKEVIVVVVAVILLGYLGISVQDAAAYIKIAIE